MGKLNLKYGFHDTSVTDVKAEADTFILSFESGVYCLDKNGKETNLTPYCQIVIKFSDKHIDQHVIIEQRYKGNYHEINISDFFLSVENNKFDIVIDYYSPFAKSIVLSGYVGKYQMNLVLSEIDEVAINFP